MSNATLAGRLPTRSGLSEQMAEEDWRGLIDGTGTSDRYAIVRLTAVEAKLHTTADGKVPTTRYEIETLEVPVGDDASRLLSLLVAAQAARAGGGFLPLDWSAKADDEQRELLLEQLYAWAEHSEVDLVQRWWEMYERSHIPDPRSASLSQLRAFAIDRGIFTGDPSDPGDADGAGRTVGAPETAGEVAAAPPDGTASPASPPKRRRPKPKPADPFAAVPDEPSLDEE